MHAKPVMAALCVCLAMPIAADARQGGQLTVVAPDKSAISYEKWTDRAASRLSRSIRQATSLYRDGASTGYSRVQFRLGAHDRHQRHGHIEQVSCELGYIVERAFPPDAAKPVMFQCSQPISLIRRDGRPHHLGALGLPLLHRWHRSSSPAYDHGTNRHLNWNEINTFLEDQC